MRVCSDHTSSALSLSVIYLLLAREEGLSVHMLVGRFVPLHQQVAMGMGSYPSGSQYLYYLNFSTWFKATSASN